MSKIDLEGLDKEALIKEARAVFDKHGRSILEAGRHMISPDVKDDALGDLAEIDGHIVEVMARIELEPSDPNLYRELVDWKSTKDALLEERRLLKEWRSIDARSEFIKQGLAVAQALAPIALEASKAILKAKLGA